VPSCRDLLAASWSVFWLTLKQLPQEREQCLEAMIELLEIRAADFMVLMYHSEIAGELLYLFDQLPVMRPRIVCFIKLVLPECTFDQTIKMLEFKTHLRLTEALEWAMRVRSNECL
jgi:hypothetical protein